MLVNRDSKVTVLERVLVPGAVGAGIGLQPIGLTVLRHLGILDSILAHGSRIDRLHCVNTNGRTVLDCRYSQFDPRLFGIGLHRGVLFEELRGAAVAEPNCSILTGCDVQHVKLGSKTSIVRFQSPQGTTELVADLVIVADGARSKLRKQLGIEHRDRSYPYGCLWSLIPDLDRIFSADPLLFQCVNSTQRMLGFLPSGRLHQQDVPQVSLFWSIKASEVQQWRDRGLRAWKEEVLKLEPRAAPLLQHLTDASMLQFAEYNDVSMPNYNHKNLVFLGDAAHANSPQLGQGANLALVDAFTLAESLSGKIPNASVESVLEEYNRQRHRRVSFYQLNSRLLTPIFQSDSRVLGFLRDMFMGPMCYFPPTRQQILTTLVGAQASLLPLHRIPSKEYLGFLS